MTNSKEFTAFQVDPKESANISFRNLIDFIRAIKDVRDIFDNPKEYVLKPLLEIAKKNLAQPILAEQFFNSQTDLINLMRLAIEPYLMNEDREQLSFFLSQTSINQMYEVIAYTPKNDHKNNQFLRLTPSNFENFEIDFSKKIELVELETLLTSFSVPQYHQKEFIQSFCDKIGEALVPENIKNNWIKSVLQSKTFNLTDIERLQLATRFDVQYQNNIQIFEFLNTQIEKIITPHSTPEQVRFYKEKYTTLDNFIESVYGIKWNYEKSISNYLEAVVDDKGFKATQPNESNESDIDKTRISIQKALTYLNFKRFATLLSQLSVGDFLSEREVGAYQCLFDKSITIPNTPKTDKKQAVNDWYDIYSKIFNNAHLEYASVQKFMDSLVTEHTFENDLKAAMAFDLKPVLKKSYLTSDTSQFIDDALNAAYYPFLAHILVKYEKELSDTDAQKIAYKLMMFTNGLKDFYSTNDKGGTNIDESQAKKLKFAIGSHLEISDLLDTIAKCYIKLVLTDKKENALRNFVVHNLCYKSVISNDIDIYFFSVCLRLLKKHLKSQPDHNVNFFNTAFLKDTQRANFLESCFNKFLFDNAKISDIIRKTQSKYVHMAMKEISVFTNNQFDTLLFEKKIEGCAAHIKSMGDLRMVFELPPESQYPTSSEIIKNHMASDKTVRHKKFLNLFSILPSGEEVIDKINPKSGAYIFNQGTLRFHAESPNLQAAESNVFHEQLLGEVKSVQDSVQAQQSHIDDLEIKLELQKNILTFMELGNFCKTVEAFLPTEIKIETRQIFNHFKQSVEKYIGVRQKIALIEQGQSEHSLLGSIFKKNVVETDKEYQKSNDQITRHLLLLNQSAQSLKINIEHYIHNQGLRDLLIQEKIIEKTLNQSQNLTVLDNTHTVDSNNNVVVQLTKTMKASK